MKNKRRIALLFLFAVAARLGPLAFGADNTGGIGNSSGTISSPSINSAPLIAGTTDQSNPGAAEQPPQAELGDAPPNNFSDRELIWEIRNTIDADETLGNSAKNVKIFSSNNKVTLSGIVETQAEKDGIGAQAAQLAGAQNLINNISVKTPGSVPLHQ